MTSNNNKQVIACIVTYNRQELLLNCIDAILNQTYHINELLIINNNSTDNTIEVLAKNNYIQSLNNYKDDYELNCRIFSKQYTDIIISVIDKFQNEGGAGGFYSAMKYAYDNKYEWCWLMDDDGLPEKNQLKELFSKSLKYNLKISNALVCDLNHPDKLVFSINGHKNYNHFKNKEIEIGEMNPYNGTFINYSVMDKIGFTKKEMFIWGDEVEYMQRALKYGYKLVTICTAIHFHPENKSKIEYVIPHIKVRKLIIPNPKFSHYYFRNLGYINKQYHSKSFLIKVFIYYILAYITRFDIRELNKFIKYYLRGTENNFNK